MRWGRCVRYMAQWHTSIIKKRGCPKWNSLSLMKYVETT